MMDIEKIKTLLDKIESDLGHYSPVGGIDCPYIKTDNKSIKESVANIRAEVKKSLNVIIHNKSGLGIKQDGQPQYNGKEWIVTFVADN